MTDVTSIRLARASDLVAICGCAKAAYRHYVPRIGREPAPMVADFPQQIAKHQVYVLVENRIVLGYVVFYPRDDHVHIENVAVRPRDTGRGFGRQLLSYAEQAATKQGFRCVELYTNAAMHENVAMYPKLGYVETGRRRQDGFDRVFFKKSLC